MGMTYQVKRVPIEGNDWAVLMIDDSEGSPELIATATFRGPDAEYLATAYAQSSESISRTARAIWSR